MTLATEAKIRERIAGLSPAERERMESAWWGHLKRAQERRDPQLEAEALIVLGMFDEVPAS